MTPETLTQKQPRTTYRKDYQPPAFWIDEVELTVDLGREFTTVRSRLSMRRNLDAGHGPQPLVLHGEEMELVSVSLDGVPLAAGQFRVDEESLTVPDVPASFELETEVRIKPQENTKLSGLYRSGSIFCTQCESEGFRRITYFLDRPDVMARYTTTISADKREYPVLLSNGNLVEEGDLPVGRHFVRWQDPWPKPSYLFALVAGKLSHIEDRFTTRSGREVTLRIFVEPQNVDKCDHAMWCLKQAMKWDEEAFGREYDLDLFMIVAVNDFNFGAMENKGLNIFNSKYVLARPDTATDQDFERILGVVAHEYFHNWTGNRVTCRDWFQLSLKEGLTIYRDQECSADLTSAAIRRLENVEMLRSKQFAEDAGPMSHPVRPDAYIEIGNFYTLTVYVKGAEVVRLYETLLGKEGFRRGMDLYFERHDGHAVTCDDFRTAMADANGFDLKQFERWYSQSGTPVLQAQGSYDPAAHTYTLTLAQSCPPTPGQPEKQPFVIPVSMGLLDRQGRPLPLQLEGEAAPLAGGSRVLTLNEREQEFRFVGLQEEPVVSLLRGFSAPVKLRLQQSRADLALLWAHDPDDFNRWEAGNRLGVQVLLELVAAVQTGRPLELDETFAEAFGRNLEHGPADQALLAMTLALPSEEILLGEMEAGDPQAVHAAREFARNTLAARFKDRFLALYEACDTKEPYFFDPPSAARRSLKNACLAYLCATGDPAMVKGCASLFHKADNMTESLAALGILSGLDVPEREAATRAFYERWQKDELVLDKWFAIQAGSKLPGTLERVKALMDHPAFNLKNPNKVRALVGAFSQTNPVRFHEESGAGYEFLADVVLQVDALNPQVAARLTAPFTRWKRLKPLLGEQMKAQLARMLATDGLSKDTYEIVSKSLS